MDTDSPSRQITAAHELVARHGYLLPGLQYLRLKPQIIPMTKYKPSSTAQMSSTVILMFFIQSCCFSRVVCFLKRNASPCTTASR